MTLFYVSSENENCVGSVSKLFAALDREDKVSASLSERQCEDGEGVSMGSMTAIHHHLASSESWKEVLDWQTEVEYTIPHPAGEVTASDTASDGEAKIFREDRVSTLKALCGDAWGAKICRVKHTPVVKIDFNVTRFSSVKIMSTKSFVYETPRSCWRFKLIVFWEGESKDAAEKSPKKFRVLVESVRDKEQVGVNVMYTAASFLEKILDIVSLDSKVGRLRMVIQNPGDPRREAAFSSSCDAR
ncbi:unknown [Feldmannia species virus]|uniref:Uncharacterized protein n=1 Tax=Feldmannia species virus TaxID=39420 RepID=B5LWB4_9PHYC|nr:hypothetical protein FeldSpV_gp025 [Feldmannia species virus]ACH46777.1 unknown [Feldmannia species virus]